MIHLTRINHTPLVLNSDLIEYVEKTPDTVVSLTNGQKLLVLESPDDIIAKVVDFRHKIMYARAADRGISSISQYPFPVSQPAYHKNKHPDDKE